MLGETQRILVGLARGLSRGQVGVLLVLSRDYPGTPFGFIYEVTQGLFRVLLGHYLGVTQGVILEGFFGNCGGFFGVNQGIIKRLPTDFLNQGILKDYSKNIYKIIQGATQGLYRGYLQGYIGGYQGLLRRLPRDFLNHSIPKEYLSRYIGGYLGAIKETT